MEMVEAARRYPGELVLVAIGPLTNVALACKLDPTFAQNGELAVSPIPCSWSGLQH